MGAESTNGPKRCFRGERHGNKILKVQYLLSKILLSLRRLHGKKG